MAEVQSLKGRNGKVSQAKVREMADEIRSASTIKAVYDALPEPANIMSLDNYSRQPEVV